jgi:hypothetical protein
MSGSMEDLVPWVSGRGVRSVVLRFEAMGQLSIINREHRTGYQQSARQIYLAWTPYLFPATGHGV